ncbi:hypothetical protein CDS [Bradyrhizobium sp.]|nr:hypothetical protein CDS [Bradyrhizobium sp.]
MPRYSSAVMARSRGLCKRGPGRGLLGVFSGVFLGVSLGA